jgi:hypothetical protein
MGAKQTVYDDFQNFNVDDDEAGINDNMEKAGYRSGNHFRLTQCNTYHGSPTLRFAIIDFQVASQTDVTYNLAYTGGEEPYTSSEDNQKNNAGDHIWRIS